MLTLRLLKAKLTKPAEIITNKTMTRFIIIIFLILSLTTHAQDSLQYRPASTGNIVRVDGTYQNELQYSLYLPSNEGVYPVVIFINGVGNDVRDWNQYKDWPMAAANMGLAAIVYEAEMGNAYDNSVGLLEKLLSGSMDARIDPENIVLWMCSSNSPVGIKLLMDSKYSQIKGASMYYPAFSEDTPFRTDVKIELVKAGLDSYSINQGIDHWLISALKHDIDLTFINFPGARHAFDMYDDEEPESARIVQNTLNFLTAMADGNIHVSNPSITVQRLINLLDEGKIEEARTAYEEAIASAPEDNVNNYFHGLFRSSGLLAIAERLKQQDKPREALIVMQWALDRQPNHPENHLVISRQYAGLGQQQQALHHAERAMELSKDFGHPNKDYVSKLKEEIRSNLDQLKK